MQKTIYLIRHGQTEYNRLRIIQGSGVDSDLNNKGLAQAAAFYQSYHHIPFEVVLTSALKRTHQTVQPFIEQGIPWEQFTEINEMNWGVHEGKGGDPALRRHYLEMINSWAEGNFKASVEGGESALELSARLGQFIEHLHGRPEQTILICSHGRAMRCLVCLMKKLPLQKMEQFRHSNTGLYKLTLVDGIFNFEMENDTSHLD